MPKRTNFKEIWRYQKDTTYLTSNDNNINNNNNNNNTNNNNNNSSSSNENVSNTNVSNSEVEENDNSTNSDSNLESTSMTPKSSVDSSGAQTTTTLTVPGLPFVILKCTKLQKMRMSLQKRLPISWSKEQSEAFLNKITDYIENGWN
jgi:hypothetical protein